MKGLEIRTPSSRPCGSCPYRRDVPSGVWADEEYENLPAFDNETFAQPPKVFICHEQNSRLCAGWVAVHDMENSLGLRLIARQFTKQDLQAIYAYRTDVPLFASGSEAAAHGRADLDYPGDKASRVIAKLTSRKGEKDSQEKEPLR